ncbi:MAG: hypothetical protein MK135_08160 [Polyangiaceae bacterium]|nr:hypothetical protein [Polyangiaceae bacterium]
MKNWLIFRLERIALRGPLARIGIILLLLTIITLVGGIFLEVSQTSKSQDPFAALWWALLRVSDSGYLSDDDSSLRRALLSILLSISGTAFLVGGVAAVMTQWLDQKLTRLSSGTTPVVLKEHVVILGWSDRAPELIRLLLAREPKRTIVLFVQEPMADQLERLRRRFNYPKAEHRLILRTGRLSSVKHLNRTALHRAAEVYYPGLDAISANLEEHAPRWLRTLATLKRYLQEYESLHHGPKLTIELSAPELRTLAKEILPQARLLAGDALIGKSLYQLLEQSEPSSNSRSGHLFCVGFSGTTLEFLEHLNATQRPQRVKICARDGEKSHLMHLLKSRASEYLSSEVLQEKDSIAPEHLQFGQLDLEIFSNREPFSQILSENDLDEIDQVILFAERSEALPERTDERSLAALLALASQRHRRPELPSVLVEFLLDESKDIISFDGARICVSPALIAREMLREGQRA